MMESDTMDKNKLARQLATLAHRAAIEEAAEIQQRMALRQSIWMHGDRTLPLRPMMRRLEPRSQTLRNADQLTDQETKHDQTRLADLYEIIEALETMFALYHQAKDQEFAAAMADHLRTSGL